MTHQSLLISWGHVFQKLIVGESTCASHPSLQGRERESDLLCYSTTERERDEHWECKWEKERRGRGRPRFGATFGFGSSKLDDKRDVVVRTCFPHRKLIPARGTADQSCVLWYSESLYCLLLPRSMHRGQCHHPKLTLEWGRPVGWKGESWASW